MSGIVAAMMTPDFTTPTEMHALLRDTLKSFVQNRVEPQAEEYDRRGTLNLDLMRACGELGLHGVTIPEEWGDSEDHGADHSASTNYGGHALRQRMCRKGDEALMLARWPFPVRMGGDGTLSPEGPRGHSDATVSASQVGAALAAAAVVAAAHHGSGGSCRRRNPAGAVWRVNRASRRQTPPGGKQWVRRVCQQSCRRPPARQRLIAAKMPLAPPSVGQPWQRGRPACVRVLARPRPCPGACAGPGALQPHLGLGRLFLQRQSHPSNR